MVFELLRSLTHSPLVGDVHVSFNPFVSKVARFKKDWQMERRNDSEEGCVAEQRL